MEAENYPFKAKPLMPLSLILQLLKENKEGEGKKLSAGLLLEF
jgi:hypothetical protein